MISADPYDTVNAYKGVDLKTGRIIPNEDLTPDLGRVVKNVCPAPPGAKDWQPTAWSPRTQSALRAAPAPVREHEDC